MDDITTFSQISDVENVNYQDVVRSLRIFITSLFILILGMLGNVTTVYIYTRSKTLRHNKMFELILAAFDIYALFVLLPMFTLIFYSQDDQLLLYTKLAISLSGHSYYVTILCSTICRYIAVYHPFWFNTFLKKWRKRFVFIICATSVLSFTRTLLLRVILDVNLSPVYIIDIILLTSASFVSIAVLSILIIAKLMKQNAVGPQVALQNGGTRKKHMVAVKTFGAVSLCFLISYVMAYVTANRLIHPEVFYLYFLNHICNPVIYLLFNREFRAKVRELARLNNTE